MGGPETEAPGAGEEITEPVAAAEGFNKEKGLPLLMEAKGLAVDDLQEVFNKTNKDIDSINKEVDTLLED